MDNKKLFVIGIGGTGMRCLESFVHMCAIGMYDDAEINILTLDTDQSNGNKIRVEELINTYNGVKSNDTTNRDGGSTNKKTFFSAKLNLYRFATNYSGGNANFKAMSNMSGAAHDIQEENAELASLFLDENVQTFDLEAGYRAQTHLGSMMMYLGIVEAAIKYKKNRAGASKEQTDLCEFLTLISKADADARVFIFGSVFGGTGASSIPVVPRAFEDAAALLDGSVKRADFGACLLTEYFTFTKPSLEQLKRDKIVADSTFFPINSQAALQFYQADPTVKAYYRRLYHVGWPAESKDVSDKDATETNVGGSAQKNDCYPVELLCACAAYDFFNTDKESFKPEVEYMARSAEFDEGKINFSGTDFMGEKGELFSNKLGAFLSFAHIVLTINRASEGGIGTAGLLQYLTKKSDSKNNLDQFEKGINKEQCKEIDAYMKLFGYSFNKEHQIQRGWLYQINNRFKSDPVAGKFIFKSNAFCEKYSDLNDKYKFGDIFEDKIHNWEGSGLFSNSVDEFCKTFAKVETDPNENDQHLSTTKDKFFAKVYNTLTMLQHYNFQ